MLDLQTSNKKGAEDQHCHFQKFSCSVLSPTEEVITCQELLLIEKSDFVKHYSIFCFTSNIKVKLTICVFKSQCDKLASNHEHEYHPKACS